MYDRVSAVTAITNWPALGVKLPKSLADKCDVFDAVRYVETAHVVQIDTSAITTTNANDAVAELAAKLLPTESEPGQRSALDRAKAAILDRLGREILALASDAVPGIVEQLQPAFDKAVSVFTESVADLPEPLTSEALVHAGPGALSQYQAAREASQIIATMDSWLAGLVNLPAYAGLKDVACAAGVVPCEPG